MFAPFAAQRLLRVFWLGVKIDGILVKHEVTLDELKGTVAVDAFNVLYQFITTIRQRDGTPLMDSEGRITSHLSGLFYRTCNLLERGIKPVYVFDGKPSLLKENTIMQRSEKKQDALEKFIKAEKEGDEEAMRTYSAQSARLEGHMIDESKQLLSMMGVPWIAARTEAEAQCAFMSANGLADAAASQDFDSLIFGANILVRNLAISGRRKLPRKNETVEVLPERYVLRECLDALKISRKQLVWIAILCGTDFDKGVFGIGAKKGLKLVREHDSFEGILKALDTDVPRWKEIEHIFLHPDVFEPEKDSLEFRKPDIDALVDYMCEQRGFSNERVQSALSRAFKVPEDSNQSSLSKWI